MYKNVMSSMLIKIELIIKFVCIIKIESVLLNSCKTLHNDIEIQALKHTDNSKMFWLHVFSLDIMTALNKCNKQPFTVQYSSPQS